jgi:alkylated DNA repair dioxygenase AlkB
MDPTPASRRRFARQQLGLFGRGPALPEGFRYRDDVLEPSEEEELLRTFQDLPFREFEFHGYLGKRRIVSYGWKYDFEERTLHEAADLPPSLCVLRERAASFAEIAPEQLVHALVTEYQPGAAIGWHRDKDVFGDVIGISLRSPCVFRLRRKSGKSWERVSITAEPRSAYLLRGPSRWEWEHSIPGVESLRYSVTFRSLRSA